MEKITFNSLKTKRDAVTYFVQFLEDYKLSLEDFKNFCFTNLENDLEYGCPKRIFDCDDSNLARAVYFIIWNDLPEMEITEIGTGKKYRGDTLNTFNTLFNRKYNRAEILSENNSEFLKKVAEFEKKFLTPGNFSVLPNKESNGFTLNLYRGQWWSYKDFYPLFLEELSLCFDEKSEKKQMKDLFKENEFYFDFIKSFENPFEKFCSVNFLEGYFDNGKIISIGTEKLKEWFENPDSEAYISFAENFMNYSTKVINARAEKMIDCLKEAMNEN